MSSYLSTARSARAQVLEERRGLAEYYPTLSVQRKISNPFKTLKPYFTGRRKVKGNKTPENKVLEQTGQVPATSRPLLVVRLAVKTGTEVRGDAKTFSEYLRGLAGHSWVEIDLGPDFHSLEDLQKDPEGAQIADDFEDSTRQQFAQNNGRTSVGFYPDADYMSVGNLLKQFFSNIPGVVDEPERHAGEARGFKTYVITNARQAKGMLNFIASNRKRAYNLLRFNCTDFAVSAIKAAGFSPPGDVTTSANISSPNRLYRGIYMRLQLGDQSAKVTELSSEQTDGGRYYDWSHVSEKDKKLIAKRKAEKLAKAANKVAEIPPELKSLDRPAFPKKRTFLEEMEDRIKAGQLQLFAFYEAQRQLLPFGDPIDAKSAEAKEIQQTNGSIFSIDGEWANEHSDIAMWLTEVQYGGSFFFVDVREWKRFVYARFHSNT